MKLLLADDHVLFRDALLLYLQRAQPDADIDVAKDFYSVRHFLKKGNLYDLILLDFRMPGMGEMQGLKELRQDYANIPVALMSGIVKPAHVKEALALGARGYFPKTLSGKALIDAIHTVLMGGMYVPTEVGGKAPLPSYYDDRAAMAEANVKNANLTPREMEVLDGLSEGLLNKEIAQNLDIEVVTVKMHVRSICMKLGVKNRTQAALKARELWLVSDD